MNDNQNPNNNNPSESSDPGLKQSIIKFLKQLVDIKSNTDEQGSIQNIKDGISMKGHTAWILVFSILIASVGLNTNSAAVVIGAMLISPLMGPILGIGLAIGTNDMATLRRSNVNLLVMIGLSVLTSFLYFSIPLVQDSTSELLSRTHPDVRDVIIALAGGAALIVAITRPSPQTNTVAGVAIATALMPPLCTAGYGLALGSTKYFFGAMFLFAINSIFIAFSTYIIVKFLGFRAVRYMDSARKKRISRITSAVAVLILTVSVYSFYQLILENRFRQQSSKFLNELREENYGILSSNEESIDYENRRITIPVLGKKISKVELDQWQKRLEELGLEDVGLVIQQEDNSELHQQVKNLQDLYAQNQKLITTRDEQIHQKEEQITILEDELSRLYQNEISLVDISSEARILYPNIVKMGFYKQVTTDFQDLDTTLNFVVYWDKNASKKDIATEKEKLQNWLRHKLNSSDLRVVSQ